MKKTFKYIGLGISLILLLILAAIVYLNSALPNIELRENYKAELSPKNIERGKYLANSVTSCFHCHSNVNFEKFSGEIVAGTIGKGGRVQSEEMGFPGNFYSSNITPHNLGNWTDAEIYRSLTSGVNKEGEPLFPLMPYSHYKYLTEEDAESIIAYLRTLQPIEADYAESEFSFPFSLILRTIPSESEPTVNLDKNDNIQYGKYLVDIAGCESCHTPTDKGTPIEGMSFAGGFEIPMETGGTCKAANITPDKETGIGSWNKEMFIKRFKYYENNDSLHVNHGDFNSEMPWRVYATMKEEDLGSIYDYLRTVKPVKNHITKFTP